MEQYLDQKDGKWHITLWAELPRVVIKNKLNFRIKSVTLNDGSVVSDPQINNSKYIFSIHESMLGKKIFFNFSFDKEEISNISKFNIGLCDEKVTWFSASLINIENLFLHENNKNIQNDIQSISKINLNEAPLICVQIEDLYQNNDYKKINKENKTYNEQSVFGKTDNVTSVGRKNKKK